MARTRGGPRDRFSAAAYSARDLQHDRVPDPRRQLDRAGLFAIPVPLKSGLAWSPTAGDALIVFALLMLMFEFIKTTRQGKSFVEHFLALLLAGGATAEFVMVPEAANSTFFMLVVICFVDLFAGFAASLRRARRAVVVAEPEPVVVAAPLRAEPVRAEPVRVEPVRAEPVRMEPVGPSRQIRSPASNLRRRPSLRPAPSRWSKSSPCKRSARELISASRHLSFPQNENTRFPSARPLARLCARRNGRDLASARKPCGDRNAESRRHRRRCRGRGGRGAVRGRAGDDRHRRRLLLPGGQARPAGVGLQRLRPRGRGGDDREDAGCRRDAQDRRDLAARRHGAGRDRSLGIDPEGAWPLRPRPRAAPCDRLRRERLCDRAARRLRLGRVCRQAQAACGLGEILSAGRRGAARSAAS